MQNLMLYQEYYPTRTMILNKYNDCEQEESIIPLATIKFNHLFWFHLCSGSEIKNNQ